MSTLNPNQTLLQSKNQSASDLTPAPLTPNNSEVSFSFQGVQPPSILYVDVDDQLAVSAATSQTNEVVTVNVRLLLPNGRLEDMQFQVRPVNTRTVVRTLFSLAQGYILSVSAVAAVATTRGQTFLRIATQRSASGAGNPAQMLFADYATTQATSAYPNGRILSPTEGPGQLYDFVVANPGAGADWTQILPVNTRWRVRSWVAGFVTSVAVANRQTAAVIKQSVVTDFSGPAIINMVASTAYQVQAMSLTPYTPVSATQVVLPLPADCQISGNVSLAQAIGVTTTNIQGADQWSGIHLHVEEWLDNV